MGHPLGLLRLAQHRKGVLPAGAWPLHWQTLVSTGVPCVAGVTCATRVTGVTHVVGVARVAGAAGVTCVTTHVTGMKRDARHRRGRHDRRDTRRMM